MEKKRKQLILGYIIISAIEKSIQHNCRVYIDDNNINTANCYKQGLVNIPQDINEPIKKLDISNNEKLVNLKEKEFQRYAELNILKMHDLNLITMDFYALRKLIHLEELDMFFFHISQTGDTILYWPPSLKILKLRATFVRTLDVSYLKKLEYLDLSQNFFRNFPKFYAYAPVKFINLTLTSVIRMRAEDVAPLCYLEKVEFNVVPDSPFLQPPKYCECKRLVFWMQEHDVEVKPAINCTQGYRQDTCNMTFSEDTLLEHQACLKTRKRSWLFYFFIFFLLLLIGGGAGGGYYYYFYLRKKLVAEPSE